MEKYAKGIANNYSSLRQTKFFAECTLALLFLLVSLIVNYHASIYATESVSNFVTDVVLSNIRAFDVDILFVYGPMVLWLFVALLLLTRPWTIPFTLKSIALFILVRALFVTLTHIGPFPSQITLDSGASLMRYFTSGGDLFFSAHTGLPFLLAIIFWQSKPLRLLFIFASLFFGIVVLLGHFHYSIDVVAAFFITYTIYHLSTIIFKREFVIFNRVVTSSSTRGGNNISTTT